MKAPDLLARVLKQPPAFLEELVLRLLVKMGYGGLETPAEHLGALGDAGLDGLIRLDPPELDVVYVQAKRYTDRHVGRPDIRVFVGALHGAQASRGIFITRRVSVLTPATMPNGSMRALSSSTVPRSSGPERPEDAGQAGDREDGPERAAADPC